MPLSDIDRVLLDRCLAREPRAWREFVDRFLGLVVHVINHTCHARSIRLTAADTEDVISEVFLTIVNEDFAVLRRFRGEACLSSYLTVIARRVVVRELLKRKVTASLTDFLDDPARALDRAVGPEERMTNRDEVVRLLGRLEGSEADVVRMYHLEGKTYHEISAKMGMPENSVGPTLSRARAKLRRGQEAGLVARQGS
ncbi:MAG: sigma-70 family RNA polymerase sigma factor [Pirellulales bacterium]